jgi:hypothetical protein
MLVSDIMKLGLVLGAQILSHSFNRQPRPLSPTNICPVPHDTSDHTGFYQQLTLLTTGASFFSNLKERNATINSSTFIMCREIWNFSEPSPYKKVNIYYPKRALKQKPKKKNADGETIKKMNASPILPSPYFPCASPYQQPPAPPSPK